MKRTTFAVLTTCLLAALVFGLASADAQAKSWKKVSTLSGSDNREGNYYSLKGGTQKLTWKLTAESDDVAEFITCAIYVMRKGTNLDDDGGFPAAWPDSEGRGSTKMHLKKGSWYFAVRSANCAWTVTLFEWR